MKKMLALGLAWGLLSLALAAPVGAAADLLPGRYQLAGQPVFAELRPLSEGAWQLSLWQGGQDWPSPAPAAGGLALTARLLAEPGQRPPGRSHLAGTWQSLPGSCCPGQGRLEIAQLSPESFAFRLFTPALDQPAWPVLTEQVWRWVADSPPPVAASLLSGGWRLSLWYTDLLPQNAPADPQEGILTLSPQAGGAVGLWQGQPGQARLEPAPQGARFIYSDPQAHFDIKADLRPQAQGLVYAGHFVSTLGEGRLLLLRQGLPATLPDDPLAGEGDLSGLWVDRRTGSDFMLIKGSAQALEFTAYGGERNNPRYLSQGQARASAPDLLEGSGQDQKDHCCGNQGRLSLKVLGPGRLQARALWWPQGQPDPGTPLEEPYLLERVTPASINPIDQGGDQWPEVFRPQPGLLASRAGAVRVSFNWQPSAPGQVATLFCQGGYRQELELFIDAQGRLAGRLASAAGLVSAQAATPLSPNRPHEAWLLYQAGKDLSLYLDGQAVATAPLAQPWSGSHSPYLVGASRYPLRDFEGSIASVELWALPPNPAAPGPATLTLNISDPEEEETPAPAAAITTVPLLRLYNPRLLRHAYALGQEQAGPLREQGYTLQGAVGRLWLEPQPGSQEVWAFRQEQDGNILLQTSAQAPAGYASLGRWGYAAAQARPGSQPLYQLQARWDDPLRGQPGQPGQPALDVLYTSRADLLPKLQEQGYGPPLLVAHLAAEPEPTPLAPLTYTWPGAWAGDGWGRFFLRARGQELFLFWYYGELSGPQYFGHLRLAADGRSAQGLAVGQPGPEASFYRLELSLDTEAPQGPRLRLKSWRLAAPLDDGRLVSFRKPQLTESLLSKTGQALPAEESALLERFMGDIAGDPQTQLNTATEQARRQERLLER